MKAWVVILSCFIFAIWLDLLPFSHWYNWIRPEITLLVLIYWAMAMPEYCGILTAALLGVVMDSLMGSFIGQHVISYSVVVSFIALAYRRIRVFDVWQQAGFVFLLIGIQQLIEHWLRLAMGYETQGLWFLVPVLVSAALWPWLMIAMRAFRRQMGLINHLI
ncbi:MAG: rod shape-determining protein MreD [Sinobacterium sp.]|nr:rod shape-determining protein MreD [Sinobacterium sp.]